MKQYELLRDEKLTHSSKEDIIILCIFCEIEGGKEEPLDEREEIICNAVDRCVVDECASGTDSACGASVGTVRSVYNSDTEKKRVY